MQYVPFASDIETPFYASLAYHKINHDQLDDSARKVVGLYEIRPADAKEHSCRMQIHGNALTSDDIVPGAYRAEGMIKNVNTIEDYRNIDKMALLQQSGQTIWDAINDGTIYSCPSLLSSFFMLSFADLKKYRFSYWLAFPALVMEPSWTPVIDPGVDPKSTPFKKLEPPESSHLVDVVQSWRIGVDPRQHGFFLAKKNHRLAQKFTYHDPDDPDAPVNPPTANTAAQSTAETKLNYTWQVAPLSAYETGFFEGEYSDNCFVAFADPSNYTENPGPVAPGWPLRNLLVLIRQKWQRDRVQVLCYRETPGRRDASRSVILDLQVSNKVSRTRASSKATTSSERSTTDEPKDPTAMPKVVGWERNAQGKLAGRFADLTAYMDPTKLADSAVDLNLKLMKWRIAPNLNLDKVKETKCLLLGAGTLGSYVARNLLGWGVRKITFVDNAGVSFSNPVRQPLYRFEDCINGGRRKAERAAEALKEIYPGVDATGHVMSVPMAGHPIMEGDAQRTREDFEKLEELVKEHDVIFSLLDSRESRWLPAVMGKAYGKIVMNAALGFDTYVVMRHGVKLPEAESAAQPTAQDDTSGGSTGKPRHQPQHELGCYFCNDVVAPGDSMKDLTLDQQCTVTRPGIAAIASALLVEILVSVLQHPLGAAAPASTSAGDDTSDHPLGIVPHQIRGFLSTFNNINVVGRSYDCCSACSDRVVDAYRTQGWEFVQRALNEKDYVEELSGLKEVQRLAEAAAADMEFDDEEEDEGVEDEDGELI